MEEIADLVGEEREIQQCKRGPEPGPALPQEHGQSERQADDRGQKRALCSCVHWTEANISSPECALRRGGLSRLDSAWPECQIPPSEQPSDRCFPPLPSARFSRPGRLR